MWLLNADIFGRKCCETVTADSGKLRNLHYVERSIHNEKEALLRPVPYQPNSGPPKMLTGAHLIVIYKKTFSTLCYNSGPNSRQNKIS